MMELIFMKGMIALRKSLTVLIVLVVALSLSLPADAYSVHSGLFVASAYSDAYHVLFCRDVGKMGSKRTYYASAEEAEADGKRPCHHCGKYIRIIRGEYAESDADRKLVDAYLEGYYAGEMVGNSEGYDQGYKNAERKTESLCSEAYNSGYKDGEAATMESLEQKIQERVRSTIIKLMVKGILIVATGVYFVLPFGISLIEFFKSRIKPRKITSKSPERERQHVARDQIQALPFNYSQNSEPPKPPRLGPADQEFTYICRSSFVAAVCHKNGHLYVKTTQGDYYMYYNVPRPVYLDFMNAPSMGKFYKRNIANNYPFSRL